MIGFKMDLADLKKNFFNQSAVISAVSDAKRKVLGQQGAYVRRVARNSIKEAGPGVHAAAGSPPKSHVGLLKKFILFAFDRSNASVVIGPALLDKRGHAPSALESGGAARVPIHPITAPTRTVWVDTTLKPRPYMGPALKASEPKLAEFWKNSVTA